MIMMSFLCKQFNVLYSYKNKKLAAGSAQSRERAANVRCASAPEGE
jgi:hypothetical protein